jgi:hypothetical protein
VATRGGARRRGSRGCSAAEEEDFVGEDVDEGTSYREKKTERKSLAMNAPFKRLNRMAEPI